MTTQEQFEAAAADGDLGAMGRASAATAAALAAAAVTRAVEMRPLSAPDAAKTYVATDSDESRLGVVDEVGLPLVYDGALIEKYWATQRGALAKRWSEFLNYLVPWLTKVVSFLIRGGLDELNKN